MLYQQPQVGPFKPDSTNPLANRLLALSLPGLDSGSTSFGTFAQTAVGKKLLKQGVFGDFGATSQVALGAGIIPNTEFTFMCGAITASGTDSGQGNDYLLGSNYDGSSEPFSFGTNSSSQFTVGSYNPGSSIAMGQPTTGSYQTFFCTVGAGGVTDTWTLGYIGADGVETSSSGSVAAANRTGFNHWVGAGANNNSPWRQWARPILWYAVFAGKLTAEQRKAIAANPWQLFADEDDEDVWVAAATGNSAALAWLEANDVSAISATATVSGAASWSEASDASAIAAQAAVSASLAWVEASDSTSIAASASVSTSSAWTEASDVSAIASTVRVNAAPAWIEQSDATAISASVGSAVSAALAWTEASDVAAIASAVSVTASASWAEQADTTTIGASVGSSIAANLAWTEASDTTAALATVRVSAAAGWAEQSDLSGFSASVLLSAGLAWTEAADVSSLAASVGSSIAASLAWAEQSDVTHIAATSAAIPYPPPIIASRTVVFDGGTRVIAFDGGTNTVAFDGGTKTVVFDSSTNTVGF